MQISSTDSSKLALELILLGDLVFQVYKHVFFSALYHGQIKKKVKEIN